MFWDSLFNKTIFQKIIHKSFIIQLFIVHGRLILMGLNKLSIIFFSMKNVYNKFKQNIKIVCLSKRFEIYYFHSTRKYFNSLSPVSQTQRRLMDFSFVKNNTPIYRTMCGFEAFYLNPSMVNNSCIQFM